MAKKTKKRDIIESDNSLVVALRDVKWLNNPVIYSQVSGDFSLWQQRVLIGILDHVQEKIKDSIDGYRNRGSFGPLFDLAGNDSDAGETLDVMIDPLRLGVSPNHYAELSDAVTKLGKQTMKYPIYGKDGKIKKYVIAPLFARLEMPSADVRRTGQLRVVMLKENINDFFDMSQGYITHVARIAQICNKKRTPRLYIYFCRYRDVGHKQVLYNDLVEYLGLTDEYYKEDGKADAANPFSKFSKVKSLILEPSRDEMNKLCDDGEVDFTFDYEPIYKNGRQRGNPEFILFSFIKGPLGKYRDQVLHRAGSERKLIGWFINFCNDLKGEQIAPIVRDVPAEHWENFKKYAYGIKNIIEQVQPDDVASYILYLLDSWKPEVEIKPEQPLFDEEEIKEAPEGKSKIIQDDARKDEWSRVVETYNGPMSELLSAIKYAGSYNSFYCLKPTPEQKAMIDANKDEWAVVVELARRIGEYGSYVPVIVFD